MPKGYKKRLTQKPVPHWSIPPPLGGQTRAPDPYSEGDRSNNLWDTPRRGENPTPLKLARDVIEERGKYYRGPRDFLERLRKRLGKYRDQGPDINQSVPRAQFRYKDE